MIIDHLSKSNQNGLSSIRARVVWEDCDRPDAEIYIDTESCFDEEIFPNPHAFLVGCLVPALRFGEKRIKIDHPVCPTLKEGLLTAMALFAHWSNGDFTPLTIESQTGLSPAYSNQNRKAGLFLSGGFDSLAALRLLKQNYPDSHPAAVKDGLLVHGFDIGGVIERGMKYHVFERAKTAMQKVADDTGINLIPIYTNIRHLCDERELWLNYFFGAVLAAVGHALSKRLSRVYIASSYNIPNLAPCGSHPMLDPEYSSADLIIRHRDVGLSRIDKLKIVSQWDVGLQNFRVCLANVKDRLNCGVCEKCVRTKAELIAIDALHKTRAFVEKDLKPEELSKYNIHIRHRAPFYREMVPLLEQVGRYDLSEAIVKMLAKPS